MAFLSRPYFKVGCIVVLLNSFNVVASDDDYLKMLEGEAEGVTLDQSGQLKDTQQNKDAKDDIIKANWKWEGDLEANVAPSGLAQDEFTTFLKQNFYGTFVFFRKLNSVDQSTVYYRYTKSLSANLDSIRDDILSHLKK